MCLILIQLRYSTHFIFLLKKSVECVVKLNGLNTLSTDPLQTKNGKEKFEHNRFSGA
jgi:hypothetical protein